MQFFLEDVVKLWQGWEFRALILLSLFYQIFLTILGSRRKYLTNKWLKVLIWLAYLTADGVASTAMGTLFPIQVCGDRGNSPIHVFWIPFLLLHVGGPDTITAYALEDNDLWPRHVEELIAQVMVASFIFIKSWINSTLMNLFIPIFITGTIKYGERTLALWLSCTDRFKASAEDDPGPYLVQKAMQDRINLQDSDQLSNAYKLFLRFARLFAGLVLNDDEAFKTSVILNTQVTSAKDAFHLIAIELGFMYDMLYAKASIVYCKMGIFVRCICFFLCVFTLLVFAVKIDAHAYKHIDILITYLLLVAAIALELYGFIQHLLSDWTNLWLNKSKNPKPCPFHSLFTSQKSWSESVGQINLINYSIKDMSTIDTLSLKLFNIINFEYKSFTSEEMNIGLEEMIFNQLKTKVLLLQGADRFPKSTVLAHRGDYVLKEKYGLSNQFNWCTVDLEFEYNLLVWHIATTIHDSDDHGGKGVDDGDRERKICRYLSDYMLYLLVIVPSIMPQGFGDLRFKETCDQAKNFFKARWFEGAKINMRRACMELRTREVPSPTDERDKTLSVLKDGCNLARQLGSLESENVWSYEEKWKMVSEVWVEMLTYAAVQSGWREHIQQLQNGGELITHVRLLMAHLGLSEQYRSYGIHIP